MGGEKTLTVSKIRNGTVIDHIPSGRALKVLRVLGVDLSGHRIAVLMNVESKKLGMKDIIKIEDYVPDKSALDRIALVAPRATITEIRDYEKVSKRMVEPPRTVEGILRCPNPTCITRAPREPVVPRFRLVSRSPLAYRCVYCGSIVREGEIESSIIV